MFHPLVPPVNEKAQGESVEARRRTKQVLLRERVELCLTWTDCQVFICPLRYFPGDAESKTREKPVVSSIKEMFCLTISHAQALVVFFLKFPYNLWNSSDETTVRLNKLEKSFMEIFLKTFLKITCQNQETCLLLVLNTLHGSPWLSMCLWVVKVY